MTQWVGNVKANEGSRPLFVVDRMRRLRNG